MASTSEADHADANHNLNITAITNEAAKLAIDQEQQQLESDLIEDVDGAEHDVPVSATAETTMLAPNAEQGMIDVGSTERVDSSGHRTTTPVAAFATPEARDINIQPAALAAASTGAGVPQIEHAEVNHHNDTATLPSSSDETLESRTARIRTRLANNHQDVSPSDLDVVAKLSAEMTKDQQVKYTRISGDEPLLYTKPPYTPASSNEDRPNTMTYKYTEINHDTHFRLFRMLYSENNFDPVEGSLEVFPYDQHPDYGYIMNSAAFSTEDVSWIQVDSEPFPVPKGFEYFLRRFRSMQGEEGDLVLFALVLCLDATEPKLAMRKALRRGTPYMDAIEFVNSWSDDMLQQLEERKDPLADQSVKLPHPRQLDAQGWAGKYSPIHMPLDRTVREIRLLSLQIYDGQPHFFTWHTSLRENGPDPSLCYPYVALSYTWGQGINTLNIQGNDVPISQNLHDFLMASIDKGREAEREGLIFARYLIYWIDALCINQNDEREKIYQIKRMHEIYSKAVYVIAWIGQGDLNFFQQTIRHMNSGKRQPAGDDLAYKVRMNIPLRWDPLLCKVLMDTYARPYFTRAWTTQELVSAQKILVQCGRDYVPMDYLAVFSPAQLDMPAFLQVVEDHPAGMKDKIAFIRGITVSRPGFVNRFKARRAARKPVTLLSLLLATLNMQATIPKDKIYSLWSIADDAAELLGEPNYTQTDAQLYTELMTAWMKKYRRMDILAVRSVRAFGMPTPNCPSWVVDWNDYDRQFRPFLSAYPSGVREDALDEPEHNRLYDACRGLDYYVNIRFARPGYSSSELSPAMITAGISCDTIAYVTATHRDLQLAQEWLDFADEEDLYAALVAGRSPDGNKIEPEDPRKYFEQVDLPDQQEYYDAIVNANLEEDPVEYFNSRAGRSAQYFENIAWRQHIQSNAYGRKLAVTEGGHIGLVPETALAGDEIAVIFNCSVPLVFKKMALGGRLLLGDAYFHRMMDGQMVEAVGGGDECLLDMYKCVEKERQSRIVGHDLNVEGRRAEPGIDRTGVEISADGGPSSDETITKRAGKARADVATSLEAGHIIDQIDTGLPPSRAAGDCADLSSEAGPKFDDTATDRTFEASDNSARERPEVGLSEGLWCDQLGGSMLDVLNATTRTRQPGDEGVWVQLFHLPGLPDSDDFRDYVQKRAEDRWRERQQQEEE